MSFELVAPRGDELVDVFPAHGSRPPPRWISPHNPRDIGGAGNDDHPRRDHPHPPAGRGAALIVAALPSAASAADYSWLRSPPSCAAPRAEAAAERNRDRAVRIV
jgi:hypothetical protein